MGKDAQGRIVVYDHPKISGSQASNNGSFLIMPCLSRIAKLTFIFEPGTWSSLTSFMICQTLENAKAKGDP